MEPRPTRRIQVDDHVPDIRDGNERDNSRRTILRSSRDADKVILNSESSPRTLVAPVTSRRYSRDIPAVDTGARMSLRRLKKN